MKLILINYSMSPKSLVFSHQRETVLALAQHFKSIHVFTPEPFPESLPDNVKVSKLAWKRNSIFTNIFQIYKALLPTLIRNRDAIVFTHMTDVHAALISPLTWILRIRHVLWYAHAVNSVYLIWSSFFVSGIVSSTKGSCNLKVNKHKVTFINQGIKEHDFPYVQYDSSKLDKAFYYGRVDASKNIHRIIDLVEILNNRNCRISLDIYGKPANSSSEDYLDDLKSKLDNYALKLGVNFKGPIERSSVNQVTRGYGVFINLFTGSLDKTLIEVTFLGIPVITWNQEYCSQFGTWSEQPVSSSLDFILEEFQSLEKLDLMVLNSKLSSRASKAIALHSFDGWVKRLVCILKDIESL